MEIKERSYLIPSNFIATGIGFRLKESVFLAHIKYTNCLSIQSPESLILIFK